MKKSKLENAYNEINAKYNSTGNVDKDQLNKDVELLDKQIHGMIASAAKTEDAEKRKKIKEQIKAAKVRKQNLEGYEKYGDQISKIQDYKNSLSKKLKSIEKSNEDGTKRLESLNKALESRRKNLEDLNKQNDPKKTVDLTNKEYDELQEKIKNEKTLIAKIEKEISEIKSKVEPNKKKIEELKGKIGKCDLAWKTLFTNKDWDEIQKRSIEDNKRYTKKENVEEKDQNKDSNKDENNTTVNKVNNNLIVSTKKPSFFKRFTNFFKKTAKNVKEYFFGNNEELDETSIPKKDVSDRVKEIKENIAKSEENKAPEKTAEKDKFIEGLRFNVDSEYRKNVTESKEKAYIEKHKAKPAKVNTEKTEKEEER